MWNLWKYGNRPVLKDNINTITYKDIRAMAKGFKKRFGSNNLVYFQANNDTWTIATYLGLLLSEQVIMIVDKKYEQQIHNKYKAQFKPNLEYANRQVKVIASTAPPMHKDLALLLPTSGSTGNSKFVKITRNNIKANVTSILDFLPIDKNERPILGLPMSYVFGLSVIHSHVAAGACIYVPDVSCFHPSFWAFARQNNCTSFSNVSLAFEMMMKFNISIPLSIKYFAHSGGKLNDRLIAKLDSLCAIHKMEFYRMYGATECMSRMTYLPQHHRNAISGCVGIPVKHGKIELKEGKVVYSGPNVAMGYATSVYDLIKTDEWQGIFESGDLGHYDEHGYLVIDGRESRFTKQHGYRYSLDDLENIIETHFDCECMMKIRGDEDLLVIGTDKEIDKQDLSIFFKEKEYMIDHFMLQYYPSLPHNNNGKKDYKNFDKCIES